MVIFLSKNQINGIVKSIENICYKNFECNAANVKNIIVKNVFLIIRKKSPLVNKENPFIDSGKWPLRRCFNFVQFIKFF